MIDRILKSKANVDDVGSAHRWRVHSLRAASFVLDPQMRLLPDWNRAFKRLASPTRSVPNCKMIQHSDWIAFRKRARLSSNAWSTCCPKRLLGPHRQELLPRQPDRNRLQPPHHRRLPQSEFRPNNLAGPVHRNCLLEILRLRNPIARRKRLAERTRRELPGSSEMPTGTIRPDGSPKTANVPVRPTGTNWVVSETTSPIDYSPLVTALIRSTSQVKDAPNTLTIRCRGRHTELLVHTDGAWGTTRGNELHVDYQINDQPAVGQQWISSADGKTATYKDDPVGLLQSLPDGARLKINVADTASSSHEAMFQLDGWDAVRKKIGTACKWARTADKASSDKR